MGFDLKYETHKVPRIVDGGDDDFDLVKDEALDALHNELHRIQAEIERCETTKTFEEYDKWDSLEVEYRKACDKVVAIHSEIDELTVQRDALRLQMDMLFASMYPWFFYHNDEK